MHRQSRPAPPPSVRTPLVHNPEIGEQVSMMTVNARGGREEPDLDITGLSIKVQVEVFDISILSKFICDVLFCSFLMDVRDHYDPPVRSWERALLSGSHMAQLEGGGPTSRCPRLCRGFHAVKLPNSSNMALAIVPTHIAIATIRLLTHRTGLTLGILGSPSLWSCGRCAFSARLRGWDRHDLRGRLTLRRDKRAADILNHREWNIEL